MDGGSDAASPLLREYGSKSICLRQGGGRTHCERKKLPKRRKGRRMLLTATVGEGFLGREGLRSRGFEPRCDHLESCSALESVDCRDIPRLKRGRHSESACDGWRVQRKRARQGHQRLKSILRSATSSRNSKQAVAIRKGHRGVVRLTVRGFDSCCPGL